VEDNPEDAYLLQETLSRQTDVSFQIQWVDRLCKGLELATGGRFDIVLLDLSLPDSQGFDTFPRMRAAAPRTPVIVLTGRDDQALATKTVKEAPGLRCQRPG